MDFLPSLSNTERVLVVRKKIRAVDQYRDKLRTLLSHPRQLLLDMVVISFCVCNFELFLNMVPK